MEAQQVVEKILADAKAEAERIKKAAAEKEAAEQANQAAELKEYKKQTKALAQKAGEDRKLHLLAGARMEAAKEFLAEKRKILEEVFSKAQEKFEKLSDEEYRKVMKKLMLEAVETGDEEVIVGKGEKRIDQDFIKQVNSEPGRGCKGELRLSAEREDLGGGFILRRGKIKTNVSTEVLLAQARKELEIELAKELFKK
jgi:V/A-type H+-transporting ATPase subunit E